MGKPDKFSILRKVLLALGFSAERVDEIVARIQEWLLDDEEEKSGKPLKPRFPYKLRDDFLTKAEYNFYQVLKTTLSEKVVICPKVSLGDLFYAQTGDYGQNRAYRNKIDRKHVDFLVCNTKTMQPVIGVELDDRSHQRPDRKQRDRFVDGVFAAAGLPLVHIPVRHSYVPAELKQQIQQAVQAIPAAPPRAQPDTPQIPNCPTCGATMILRTAKSGANPGNQFWGCAEFPNCRGIVDVQ